MGCGMTTCAENFVGRRFGRLSVVARSSNAKSGNSRWLCFCECGNETVVVGSSLKNGGTRSCGCLHSDVTAASNKKRFHGNRPYSAFDWMEIDEWVK